MIIEIENLEKSFKEVKAVDGVSFKVKEGELFAFLGINGAGKSTTINIICGTLKKDGGTVKVCGYDIDENSDSIKGNIGIVFQNSVLDKKLSVYDNLKSRAGLYGIFGKEFKARLEQISNLLDLKEILKRPISKLSGGQKRRIDIARALLHNPKLLILDEPTTGLDPKTRKTVWSVIDMEEAAEADYVVILDSGKKVAEGTPHELKNTYANDYVRIYSEIEEAEKTLAPLGYVLKKERDFLEIELKKTNEATELIKKYPKLFTDFEVLKGNMDNVFLKVTGKDLEGM